MLPAGKDVYSAEKAAGSAPLGWRLAMKLCNLLIALTMVGFAALLVYEYKLLSYF